MAIDRRSFLKIGGAGLLGVTFTSLLPGCEEFLVTPLGNNTDAPFVTPIDQFFVQNGGEGSISGWQRPQLTQANWSLKISDLVTPPNATTLATLTFADLMALKDREVTVMKTVQCVLESPLRTTPTGFMGNAWWTGIPLSAVLEQVTLRSSIKRLLFYGADGFFNNIKIERVRDAAANGQIEPLIVYNMNGKPLPDEHGAPVRLIIEEGYGYTNVKWLSEIRATTFNLDTFGTYQQQGFVDDGIIRVTSRSTNVRDDISLPAGPIAIRGFAVSGYAPIASVEVSIDGGPYTPARIVPLDEIRNDETIPPLLAQITRNDSFPWKGVWAEWNFIWEATQGSHTVAIRATDSAGNFQPETDTNVFDGNTGVARYSLEATG